MIDHEQLSDSVSDDDRDLPLGGLLIVMRLLKRWRLVNTLLDPATVDDGWCDNFPSLLREVSVVTLGYDPGGMQSLSRGDLWRIAKTAVAWIEERSPRCDHYPEGWQEDVRLIKHGRAEGPARKELDPHERRMDWLEQIRYAESYLSLPGGALLERLGATKRDVTAAHAKDAMAMVEKAQGAT